MSEETLEEKCKEAVLKIADHVKELVDHAKDINAKASHFLENYRKDYYDALDGINYQKTLEEYKQ